MAKTLAKAIEELKIQNQGQVVEQTATRRAIETLNDKFDMLLDRTPTDAEREEEKRESKRRAKVDASQDSPSSSLANIQMFGIGGLVTSLSGLAGTAASIAGVVAGVTAAFVGLGPTLKEFSTFLKGLRSVLTFPLRLVTSLRRLLTFNPPAAYTKIITGLSKFFTSVSRAFSIVRIPDSVIKSFDNFANMFREGGRFAGVLPALRNNAFVRGFLKLLRPVAGILSLFDGFRNAQAEMEDREGFFNRYFAGGLGGFVSGFVGSFFGEFANLIKDAIFWPIKQLLPAEWLIENPDGSVSINREANLFMNLLGGLENIDFNRMLTNLVQTPFNELAKAFTFIGSMFTEEGRRSFSEYWNERGFFGAAADVVGWAVNLAFSPLNAILREIETAFGADAERENQTFTQRIAGYISRLTDLVWSILPSWEDLRAAIIDILPDNRVGDYIRTRIMGDYSPEEAASRRDEINAEILRLQGVAANADPLGSSMIEGQIAALQNELSSLPPAISPATVAQNRLPPGVTLPPSFATVDPAQMQAFIDAIVASQRGGGGGGGGGSVPQIVPVPIPVDRIDNGRPW